MMYAGFYTLIYQTAFFEFSIINACSIIYSNIYHNQIIPFTMSKLTPSFNFGYFGFVLLKLVNNAMDIFNAGRTANSSVIN